MSKMIGVVLRTLMLKIVIAQTRKVTLPEDEDDIINVTQLNT